MQNIYSLLTPIAMVLILVEIIIALVFKKKILSFSDSIVNLGTGMFNQCVNMLILSLVIVSYGLLYDNYNMVQWDKGFLYYGSLFVIIDFIFYWYHRWNHSINFLWAAHSPHHSSEEFNFTVGSRASITQRLFSFTFYWPLCFVGFEPLDIYMTTGIHLIVGFTHHTRLIPKLGKFIEYIFNTPSHHRVHHGTNKIYLDKNFAEVFIIWDRIFGTFKEESEPVRYGILRHPESNSITTINFHFWSLLAKDFCETKSIKDKLRLWFMPLGWRPKDVSFRSSVRAIEYGEKKIFDVKRHTKSTLYLVIQVLICLLLMYVIINAKFEISNSIKLLFSLVLLYCLESWKYLLDQSKRFMFHSFASSILLSLSIVKVGHINNILSSDLANIISFIAMLNVFVFMLRKVKKPHILGGAIIADNESNGVIDRDNKVFNYENLYVCDGSMIGANLGVNPSLTITAISEFAMSKIESKK
jgi:alkylglycerol monooxygenase